MQVGEHVDEVLTRGASQVDREQRGPFGRIEHDPVDEFHHVEGRTVDVDIGAQPERAWHGHRRTTHGADDAVLARHVVGGREDVPGRRSAEDDPRPAGIGDAVREVGPPADDQIEVVRWHEAVDVGRQPGADAVGIDSLHDRRP